MIPAPKFTPSQRVPFQEAIEWQSRQAPWISGSSWATMAGLAALKGDQVSGAVLLSVLDDVWGEIDRSVQEGLPYGEFLRNTAERMKSNWWSVESPRMRLIYHNNMGNALMAGRYKRANDPEIMESRPYRIFDGIGDWRQSPICIERDGTILQADDPWWDTNSPLLHHGCRSGIITLDADDVEELGGMTGVKSTLPVPDGWGKPYSWQSWRPKEASYHPALYAEYRNWVTGDRYATSREQWLSNLEASYREQGLSSEPWQMPEDELEPVAIDLQRKRIEKERERVKPQDTTEATIRKLLDTWVLGSKRKLSVTWKHAVKAEFGASGVPYTRVAWQIKPEDVEALRTPSRALYDDTQAALRKMYPSGVVTLYRGVKSTYAIAGIMDCWTSDYATAVKFDGHDVLRADIPIERVIAFSGGPHWVNGKYGEQYEFIVMNEGINEGAKR